MTTSNPVSFDGQVGLVTGAASGLGLAYSRLLAQRGAQVVMHDVGAGMDGTGQDPQRIARTVALLREGGLGVHAAHGSIDTRAHCQALVAAILQHHGRLDFIIHNAGWVEYQPIEALDDEHFDRMMTLAAKTPLWLAEAAWPSMQANRHGRIVLTTSDRALYPQYVQKGLAAYAAAKLAAVGIVNVLAAEGAAHGIVVNAVSPVAKTRMWGVEGEPDELHPDAVAPGVAFLCPVHAWTAAGSCGPATASSTPRAAPRPTAWRIRAICVRCVPAASRTLPGSGRRLRRRWRNRADGRPQRRAGADIARRSRRGRADGHRCAGCRARRPWVRRNTSLTTYRPSHRCRCWLSGPSTALASSTNWWAGSGWWTSPNRACRSR